MRYFLVLAVIGLVGLFSDDPALSRIGLACILLIVLGWVVIVPGGILYGIVQALRDGARKPPR